MQMHLHPASIPFGKDTVYRFLNSCHTNWRRFVLLFVKAIYRQEKKRRGRATVLLSVKAAIDRDGVTTPVRFVYVRNRAKKDYLVLVTTDMELSEEEVVRLYGKRWSIEVFFKMCKSYLRLGKECRSVSYDAMVAHVAIMFARYMLLAVEQRENRDMRSLGELFYLSADELPDIRYMEALRLILSKFAELIKEKTVLEEKEVLELLDIFFAELALLWRQALQQSA